MSSIGPYELIGRVTQTRNSTIWRATDSLLDRDVALKQVNRTAGEHALRQEATLLAALDHPNIVRVYDILVTDHDAWLVEEWVDGASLGAVRDHSGNLTTHQAVGVVHGALQGLAYAHYRDVVHGDIAPGNILVDTAGVSKLIDFGSAVRSTGAPVTGTTVTGSAGIPLATVDEWNGRPSSGTDGYQSPEVAAGTPADKTSDVYSAAAVLADLLTGKPRRHHPGTAEVPVLPATMGPIGQVLTRALATEPAARHPDAGALLADLDDAAERSLGPGWIALASVAGLATATATASAGAVLATETPLAPASVTASANTPAPGREIADADQVQHREHDQNPQRPDSDQPTAATDTHRSHSSSTVTQKANSPLRKWLAIGGGAAVTAAVIIGAVVITSGGPTPDSNIAGAASASEAASAPPTFTDSGTVSAPAGGEVSAAISPSPTVSSSPPTTPRSSAAPSPTTSAPAGLNGTYSVHSVVTAGKARGASLVGQVTDDTWTVVSACTDGNCDATVTASNGGSFTLTSSSGAYSVNLPSDGPCVGADTGVETGQTVAYMSTATFTPTVTGGLVTSLTGELTTRQTEPCDKQEPELYSKTSTYTATRTGP